MTEQEQRIAIAKACGFTKIKIRNHGIGDFLSGELMRVSPNACGSCVRAIPDYLHDLNAMHEAVDTLDISQRVQWPMELRKIVVRDCKDDSCLNPDTGRLDDTWFYDATAAQRAEAFLRTLGRWKE